MLFAAEALLDWEHDDDELTEFAALIVAFHFMMRSSEYTARFGGRFDADRIVRVSDVVFKRRGKAVCNSWLADEVEITFGKTKNSAGGQTRSQFKAKGNHKLCVVRILQFLFARRPNRAGTEALFRWPEGSKRAGEGVRYIDMVKLVKKCAEVCGRDTKLYASHSIRKGGASEYLVAGGWSLHEVALFGRWRGERIAGLYVEKVIGQLSVGMQTKVLSGKREGRARFKKPPRERDVRMYRIKRALKKED